MIHITCIAHALHHVAETVRNRFKDVDAFIGNVKSIFRKSPKRTLRLEEMYPELQRPPKPIKKKWEHGLMQLDTMEIILMQSNLSSMSLIQKVRQVLLQLRS